MLKNDILQKINKVKILVIGDIMLDIFQYGSVHRRSPEADVPVLHIDHEHRHLGGALNVCRNVLSLGAGCDIISIMGNDSAAENILALCRECRISSSHILKDPRRSTTVKRRLFRDNIQIYRVDHESRNALSSEMETDVLEILHQRIADYQAVILQDYNKGMLTENLICQCIELADQHHIPIFVDPKTENISCFAGVDFIKPNRHEAAQILGQNIPDLETAMDRAPVLFRKLKCKNLIMTLGENGCIHCSKNECTHYATEKLAAVDVTGAGDTVISTLAVLYLLSQDMETCLHYANKAGGMVCAESGVVPVNKDLFN